MTTARRVAAIALVTAGALLFRRRAPFVAPLVVAAGALVFTLLDATPPTARTRCSCRSCSRRLGGRLAARLAPGADRARCDPRCRLDGLHPRSGRPVDGTDLAELPAHRHLRPLGCRGQALGASPRRAEERARRTEEEARRAVEDERNRITRELHDVLAHSVSVMTVQASAVRRLLTPEQQREREALMTVEETGRQALSEMRRLLGIMRTEEEAPALAPQPGLGTLARARRAGAPVGIAGRADGGGRVRSSFRPASTSRRTGSCRRR